MDTDSIDIDGTTYELRRWSVKDGVRWQHRIAKALLAVGGDGQTMRPAALLEVIDEDRYEQLAELVMKYTYRVEGDTKQQLSKVSAVVLLGHTEVIFDLIVAHLTREFAPFFSRFERTLKEHLGPAEAAKTKGA